MARTYPRKWTFLPVMLIALLASEGLGDGELPTATFLNGGSGKRLWQCPICMRVEDIFLTTPICPGTWHPRHDPIAADPVPISKIEGLSPSDSDYLFQEAD
jgi:hypothetical protein